MTGRPVAIALSSQVAGSQVTVRGVKKKRRKRSAERRARREIRYM